MKERIIKYPGKHIDVYFTVDRCTHVAECIRTSPKAFDSTRRPWIIADAAEPDQVALAVLRCPTGALHFKRKGGGPEEGVPDKNTGSVCRNGPLYLQGDLEIRNFDQTLIVKDTRIALCRCGRSRIMPLCDDSHKTGGFEDPDKYSAGRIQDQTAQGALVVTLRKNGPLDLKGPIEITDPAGTLLFRGGRISLCRCGKSERMPFCDNSHAQSGFQTEDEIVLYPKRES